MNKQLENAINLDQKDHAYSNLFRIANSVCSLQNVRVAFENYLADVADPRLSMKYFFSMGYFFSLEYYRDHKDTSSALKKRIDNILKLGNAVYEMDKILECKDSRFNATSQKIRRMLEVMCMEGEALLEDELINWNLSEYLSGIKEENKVEYIKTALSIPQGHGHDNVPQVILNSISNSALKSIAA